MMENNLQSNIHQRSNIQNAPSAPPSSVSLPPQHTEQIISNNDSDSDLSSPPSYKIEPNSFH